MIRNLLRRVALATAIVVAISSWVVELHGQRGANFGRSATAGLSRWGDRPSTLPIGPVRPIHPIHPIHPIRPWPWWGPNVVVYNPNPWGFGNYLYPPNRWDAPGWDGQTRNTDPPPAPRPPREPVRPLVMEWNAAKGRAEVVHLDRWDGATAPPSDTPAPPVEAAPIPRATKTLNRWDTPSP